MDRNQARDKIIKILALANDRAATPEEKDTAFKMAEKLAAKHGFKITKKVPNAQAPKWETYAWDEFFRKATKNDSYNTPVYHLFEFYPKNASSKFIKVIISFMEANNIRCEEIRAGRTVKGFRYYYTKSLNEVLKEIYKACFKSCNNFKSYERNLGGWYTGSKLTDEWCANVSEFITRMELKGYETEAYKMCFTFGQYMFSRIKNSK